jgi:hypothetical protein
MAVLLAVLMLGTRTPTRWDSTSQSSDGLGITGDRSALALLATMREAIGGAQRIQHVRSLVVETGRFTTHTTWGQPIPEIRQKAVTRTTYRLSYADWFQITEDVGLTSTTRYVQTWAKGQVWYRHTTHAGPASSTPPLPATPEDARMNGATRRDVVERNVTRDFVWFSVLMLLRAPASLAVETRDRGSVDIGGVRGHGVEFFSGARRLGLVVIDETSHRLAAWLTATRTVVLASATNAPQQTPPGGVAGYRVERPGDYRLVDGLLLPHLVARSSTVSSMTSDLRVTMVRLNPPLSAADFKR